jgi:SpoVK/Ycf46/Vps4 family AAA+-type ATPase
MKNYVMGTIENPKARGIIIYGVPGSGKSHFAKAVANKTGRPCLILRFSALKDKYQGVAEGRLREAFKTIRAFGKCVVFMDEIESIAVGISSGGDSGVGQSLFKDLLVELEDSRGCGAYWIGTCNALDPLIHESGGALLRRFNGIFFADMPSKEEAKGIAKIWEEKEGVQIPDSFSLDSYSGANIAQLAETMGMMNCSADQAAAYVIPYGRAHEKELEAIRAKAKEVCIWASYAEEDTNQGFSTKRKIKRPEVVK